MCLVYISITVPLCAILSTLYTNNARKTTTLEKFSTKAGVTGSLEPSDGGGGEPAVAGG